MQAEESQCKGPAVISLGSCTDTKARATGVKMPGEVEGSEVRA